MKISHIDKQIIMIDAYLIPYKRDIIKAKENNPVEIRERLGLLEQIVSDNRSLQAKIVKALKNNKNVDYYLALLELKKQYSLNDIFDLQSKKVIEVRKRINNRKSDRFFIRKITY